MAKSSGSSAGGKAKADRPPKPFPAFPLSPHASGRWQKKINGRLHYFGRWGRVVNGSLQRLSGDGWQEALDLYKEQSGDLHAGRTPRLKTDELTLADLCNRFLTVKQGFLESGELTRRTFDDYAGLAKRLVAEFGRNRPVADLTAEDFAALRNGMAKQWGPVRLGTQIQMVRTIFKW